MQVPEIGRSEKLRQWLGQRVLWHSQRSRFLGTAQTDDPETVFLNPQCSRLDHHEQLKCAVGLAFYFLIINL